MPGTCVTEVGDAGIVHDNCLWRGYDSVMRSSFTAVIERDTDTGLLVGYVPGFPGAHSQGETLDELNRNLREVIEMLLEDGEPAVEGEFIGTQEVTVG